MHCCCWPWHTIANLVLFDAHFCSFTLIKSTYPLLSTCCCYRTGQYMTSFFFPVTNLVDKFFKIDLVRDQNIIYFLTFAILKAYFYFRFNSRSKQRHIMIGHNITKMRLHVIILREFASSLTEVKRVKQTSPTIFSYLDIGRYACFAPNKKQQEIAIV